MTVLLCVIRETGRFAALSVFILVSFAMAASGQNVAIVTPAGTSLDHFIADELGRHLPSRFKVLDNDLSDVAFRSYDTETPFNLTAAAARIISAGIGCDFLVLFKTDTLRRSSFEKPIFYESNISVFVVNAHTGLLVYWAMPWVEDNTAESSQQLLKRSTKAIGTSVSDAINDSIRDATLLNNSAEIEEVPEKTSPLAMNFRDPVPYRRLKPLYTAMASYYNITATVEITIDLDESGKIARTAITRWAGYGLDESVEKTVREMNWRPAERGGQTLPMRFMLRYNFRKVEQE